MVSVYQVQKSHNGMGIAARERKRGNPIYQSALREMRTGNGKEGVGIKTETKA